MKFKPVATAEEAAFMADLLAEVDTNVPTRRGPLPIKKAKVETSRKVRVLSPPIEKSTVSRSTNFQSKLAKREPHDSAHREETLENDDQFFAIATDGDTPMSDPVPSSPTAKAAQRRDHIPVKTEEPEYDEIMEVSHAVGNHNVKATGVNISGSRPPPRIVKKASYPTPESSSPARPQSDAVDPSAWKDVTSRLNVLSSPPTQVLNSGKLRLLDAVEEDGSLRFFWTDYTEVNGSLCLFGKVKDRSSGFFVSAFVKVDNILRKLFFLPRVYKQGKASRPLIV